MESFKYDFEAGSLPAMIDQGAERGFVMAKIAGNERDPDRLTDEVFYRRHPEMRGRLIAKGQTGLVNEWVTILQSVVKPLLTLTNRGSGKEISGPVNTSNADVAAAQAIARKAVPGMPGVTIQQLIEKWRPTDAPKLPTSMLLAFVRFESGGNFTDATHGSSKNNPPFTQPAFYELGLFQTPAGLHGKCTSIKHESCEHTPPPGLEVLGDPSTWTRLCKKIGANPNDWKNPTTQVRVGLLDLKTSADAICAAYPDLFPSPGSDWYLRMAVLMPFARGGGFTRAFLKAFRANLAKLPEDCRWDFLRGKRVPVRGGAWVFDTSNVDKKMSLTKKLG